MEAGLMEIVWSLNRSWTSDSRFILRRSIHGGKSLGNVQIPSSMCKAWCVNASNVKVRRSQKTEK